ncbi:MAG: sensor histidine kinase [Sphingomonadales bacterium]|nr:sensor histidine kinase [Sphingomonadales bacterium]
MATVQPRPQTIFDDKNRAFWMLQGAGWSGYLLLRAAQGVANGMSISFFIPVLVSTATGYSLTLVIAAAFRLLIRKSPIIIWTGSLGAVGLAVAAYSVIDAFVFSMVNRGGTFEGALLLASVLIDGLLLGAWSALYYGINFFLIAEDQRVQLLKLEGAASSAQLAMLRYQLNPHFLFNTLNSISTLVLLKQTDRANAMLSRLSSFLRYTLVNEPQFQVTLDQEFETLKLYLDIEKMRFEERLRATFDLDPMAARARIPSLLLQPLVENGIKYAVTPMEEGAEIAVTARLVGERVQITVSDTGPGLNDGGVRPSYSTGVGLANIRDRLAQAYGPDHRFDARNQLDGGFIVTVEIPFLTEDASQEVA